MKNNIFKFNSDKVIMFDIVKRKYIKFNYAENLILRELVNNSDTTFDKLKMRIKDRISEQQIFDTIKSLEDKSLISNMRINGKIINNNFPIKVFLSITNMCNANCIHCFMDSGIKLDYEISYKDICSIMDCMEELGIMGVSITGGEPFIRSDIIDILQYGTEKNMAVSITTNGSLINYNIANALMKMHLKSITISLDSATQSTSEKIRKGIDFNKVLDSIKFLTTLKHQYNVNTEISVRTSVNKVNKNEIVDIYNLCDKLCVDTFKINNTNKLGRANNITNLLLEDNEFYAKLLEIKNMSKNGTCRVEMPIEKYITDKTNYKKLSACTSTIDTINILADGSVVPCGFSSDNLILGNLKEASFSNILNDNLPFDFHNKYCEICKINKYKDKDVMTNPKFIISEEKSV